MGNQTVGSHVLHGRIATKIRKHEESEERNAKWRSLSPTQQLEMLDSMFGPGLGASRQRKRLAQSN